MVELPQVLLLPAHARYDIVSEVLGTPGRFEAIAADVVVVEGFDEELEDEDAADGGDEGVDEEEMREGSDECRSFLSDRKKVTLEFCAFLLVTNMLLLKLTATMPANPSALRRVPAHAYKDMLRPM